MLVGSFVNKVRKFLVVLAVLVIGTAALFVLVTWPHNAVGRIVYRLLGKELPSRRSEDLRNIKRFLAAKRMLDKKEYAKAFEELEFLRKNVNSSFPFFKDIYLSIGYIHDVKGELQQEEALYRDLATKDKTLANFLLGLYHIHHGRESEGRKYLGEAIRLDNQFNRLGNFREVALKELSKGVPTKKTPAK